MTAPQSIRGKYPTKPASPRLRERALDRYERETALPMAVLGLAWLALVAVDLTTGLTTFLATLSTIIWIVFIIDFVVKLLIAPNKLAFLKRRWYLPLALAIPALRIAGIAAALGGITPAASGVRLVRAVLSLSRGLRALGGTMKRRGAIYVAGLSIVVTFAGAAGMYALEPHAVNGTGFSGYGDALWWVAMIMTTMGSAYWPKTLEGRILGFLIALFAIGVYGYITAMLASFFVGREAASKDSDIASDADLRSLKNEIVALRKELQAQGRVAQQP